MAEKPWNIKCPHCKNDNAYKGLQVIECPVVNCVYYTPKQENLVFEYNFSLEKETPLELPKINESDGTYKYNYDDQYGFIMLP